MELTKLNDSIKSSKNILLTSHINPDGDTLGAMCGMYAIINENYKKKCDMLVMSKIPKNYEFIPNIKSAKHFEEYDKSREYDLVINLDVASADRLADGEILFKKAKHTVNIDHHKTNNNYADINIVNPEASSASEVVADIAEKLDLKVSKEAAVALYTGVLTDTGSFRFDNTTAETFLCASKLVEYGANPNLIYKNCYETESKDLVMFQAYCVNKAEFSDDLKIAYSIVYKKDLEKYNGDESFTDGLAEKLRAIVTTEVAFIAKELNNGWTKISMRSKNIDVAEICSKFGGGGHKYASGCTIKSSVTDATAKIKEEIRKKLQ